MYSKLELYVQDQEFNKYTKGLSHYDKTSLWFRQNEIRRQLQARYNRLTVQAVLIISFVILQLMGQNTSLAYGILASWVGLKIFSVVVHFYYFGRNIEFISLVEVLYLKESK